MPSPKIVSLWSSVFITIVFCIILVIIDISLYDFGDILVISVFFIPPFLIIAYFVVFGVIKYRIEKPLKSFTKKYFDFETDETSFTRIIQDSFNYINKQLSELKQSGEKYKRLVESLEREYFLYSHNADGIFTYVSPSIKNILGYEPEEFMTDFDKYYTDNPINKLAVNHTMGSIAGIKQMPYKIELVNKYGNPCLVEVSEIPVFDTDGKVIAVEGIARDISKEELTIEALKISEQRFRSIFNNSPISIWEEDFSEVKKYLDSLNIKEDISEYLKNNPDSLKKCAELVNVIDVNEAAVKMHNAANKKDLYENIAKVFTTDSFMSFAEELVSLWKGDKEIKTDAIVQTLDGKERAVRVKCQVPKGYEDNWARVLVSIMDITDRKLVEQKLLEKDYIISSASSVIATCDLKGIMNYVNPAFLSTWGFENTDEIYGRPLWDFWMVENNIEDIMNNLGGTGRWAGEIKAKKKDGTLFDVQVSAATVKDNEGNPVCLMSSSVDITERTNVERRFRLAAELGIDLIYEWDIKSDKLTWFGDIDAALGYKPGTISHTIEAWVKLIHPFDVEQLAGAVELHRTSTKDILYDYRIMHNDGEYRYWHDHGIPMLDENNIPYKWIGICSDITEKKQTELDLSEKQAMIDFSPNIIFITETNGFVKFVNPAFLKLLKVEETSNIYGRPYWKFSNTKEKPEDIIEILKQKEFWTGEVYLKISSEDSLKCNFNASVVKDEDGKIVSLIFISC